MLKITGTTTIVGNIKGEDGASITVENESTVDNVKSEGGSGELTITASDVGGNIKTEDVDTVIMAHSTIGGNIKVEGGTTVEIKDNPTIGGNIETEDGGTVTITGNVDVGGNVRSKRDELVTITGITVAGDLEVKDAKSCDVGAPGVNTVLGANQGCVSEDGEGEGTYKGTVESFSATVLTREPSETES